MFVKLGQFLTGGLAVLVDRSELAAVVEEGDVVTDDVFVEDGHIAAGGLDVEVAEQGCADVDELTAKFRWRLLDHDVKSHDQSAGDGADN
ncbi:hypothetical protein [Fodinicola acaciae]|uniref:hypothetical protein n=1 Tax=Fodinicola acaciae TaxID=2681555 RepID=UPI0013D71F1C|nr:hypothetical protein [Fodinicola acaciae]